MIEAVIFDMDGLLIDSEPLWRQAEITAFGKVGLHLAPQECMQTLGLRIDEAVAFWYQKHPWKGATPGEVEQDIAREFMLLLKQAGPMEGVGQTMEFFRQKGLPLGLASSSTLDVIEAVIEKLGIASYFKVVCSAEHEEFGKPHPAVFITTARKLGASPVATLAFEDSFNGLLSAKAARMKTVAVPEAAHYHQTRFDIADVKLRSLAGFTPEVFEQLNN